MLMHVIPYGVYGLSCLYSSDLSTSSQTTEYKPFHGCSFIMGTDLTQFPLVEEHFFLRWIYSETLLGNECKIRSWQIVWPLASIYKPIGVHLNCIYLVFLLFLPFYGHVVYFLQMTSEISFVILYGELNSVKNTTINIWLNDGVY